MQNQMYTSYFAKINRLGDEYIPIAISIYLPKGQCGMLSYKKLAPTSSILNKYKASLQDKAAQDEYTNEFKMQVLSKLNPEQVYNDLQTLAAGKIPVLICYEKSESFCHRNDVAKWFTDNGYPVSEIIL